jgi:transposase
VVVSYLSLMTEEAPQREYRLWAVSNALRWLARMGASWRRLPPDFLPWAAVSQQTQRWLKARVFEEMGRLAGGIARRAGPRRTTVRRHWGEADLTIESREGAACGL